MSCLLANERMSTEPTRKRRIPTSIVIVAPIVLAFAYVLGFGPWYRMTVYGFPTERVFRLMEALYKPVYWACDNIPGVADFFD